MSDAKSLDRQAADRAEFLARTSDISEREAEAVAYSEMGFASSGIATQMESTRGTVRNYLDSVADQYGVTAVQATPEGERGRLSAPAVEVDMSTPTGRCVVIAGDSTHVIAERYFRTWTREERVNRDAKLALRFPEYDEQRSAHLGDMEWDDHHVTFNGDYEFAQTGVTDTGAWTADASRATIAALRERSIPVPKLDAHPIVGRVHAYRVDTDGRTCPVCEADSVCSSRDLDAFAEWSTAMELCRDSGVVTHVCAFCRRLLVNVAEYVDGNDDGGESVLLEAMHG